MRNYYAYLWLDGQGSPKYVGKGVGARALEHAAREDFEADNWTVKLWPAASQDNALAMEREIYLALVAAGYDLLNKREPFGAPGAVCEKWDLCSILADDGRSRRLCGLTDLQMQAPEVTVRGQRMTLDDFAQYVGNHHGFPAPIRGAGRSYADFSEADLLALLDDVRAALHELLENASPLELAVVPTRVLSLMERVLADGPYYLHRAQEARVRMRRVSERLREDCPYARATCARDEARARFGEAVLSKLIEGHFDEHPLLKELEAKALSHNDAVRRLIDQIGVSDEPDPRPA